MSRVEDVRAQIENAVGVPTEMFGLVTALDIIAVELAALTDTITELHKEWLGEVRSPWPGRQR